MTEPEDHGTFGVLAALVRETKRLPKLHALASFAVALCVGLGVGLTVNELSHRVQPPVKRLSQAEAIGQLVLRPLHMSQLGDAQIAETANLISEGEVGGVILRMSMSDPPPNPGMVKARVEELTRAAEGRPPLLVVLALEARLGGKGYCSPLSTVSNALRRALGASKDQDAARALGRAVARFGANVLQAASFDSRSACPGIGGSVEPAAFVAGLRHEGVALLVNGPQRPQDVDAGGYGPSGVRLVAAGGASGRCPTRPDPKAIVALRDAAPDRDLVIATPDIPAVTRAPGSCQATARRRIVRAALLSGADLAFIVKWTESRHNDIARFFEAHPDRLRASCLRVIELKREELGWDERRECPAGPARRTSIQ